MLAHTICFLRAGDRLLLLNRRSRPAMGLWTGVGGKIEPGETPLGGVLREVREETGLALAEARLAGIVTWGPAGMYAFVADLPAGAADAPPRETPEGLLAWHELAWVLHPDNAGLPRHVRLFLPAVLAGGPPREHRFRFAPHATSTDWPIAEYRVLPWTPRQI